MTEQPRSQEAALREAELRLTAVEHVLASLDTDRDRELVRIALTRPPEQPRSQEAAPETWWRGHDRKIMPWEWENIEAAIIAREQTEQPRSQEAALGRLAEHVACPRCGDWIVNAAAPIRRHDFFFHAQERRETALRCLTCGATIFDPLAGACGECGAQDSHVGTQWLQVPPEMRPLDTPPEQPTSPEAAPIDMPKCVLLHDHGRDEGHCVYEEQPRSQEAALDELRAALARLDEPMDWDRDSPDERLARFVDEARAALADTPPEDAMQHRRPKS